jgi:hypothetical protein
MTPMTNDPDTAIAFPDDTFGLSTSILSLSLPTHEFCF